MIDLPNEVKPGEVVRADDYNALLKAVRMSMIQPGVGYQRTINRSGTTLKIKDQRGALSRSINPPFSVIEVSESGGGYEVTLEPGRVCSANPVAAAQTPPQDGYDYFIPEISGTPMNQRDADGEYPKVQVGEGETIYCRIKRTATGIVESPVAIVVDERDKESSHYQPPDPADSGTEEIYQYRRIVDLDVVSGEVELTVWRRSDIDLEPFLWVGENVGTGSEVFKEHDEVDGVYNFRRVLGCYGLVDAVEDDSVKLSFEAENVGDSQSGTKANVYVEPDPADFPVCQDKAEFRPITQGEFSDRQQIQVVEDLEVVRVQGNGVNGTINFEDCNSATLFSLTFEDGLITTVVNTTVQIPACPSSPPVP